MERKSTETVAPEAIGQSPIRILSPGCEVGERYEVRSVLGMGGSGVVYAVFDRELRRSVALKVLRSDRMSESALKRFRREVAVARDAQSPHLVRVYDMAQSAESIYLTMELVEGESLARRLERGPMPVAEAIEIGAQILIALEALHAIGIVHRDIKPSNVMVTPDGVVKLTDFGLARRVDSETRATEADSVVGTYEYLSPEQALGEEIDARSDLYSFGILLFECLTGDVPLRGGSSLGTVIAHVSKPTPDVRSRRADVPRWLGGIIQRLLRKPVGDRYQSALDVRRDLIRRHAPRRRTSSFVSWVLLGLAFLIAVSIGAIRHVQGSRFSRIVSDGRQGGRAINGRGETLWSRPFLQPGVRSAIAKTPGGATRVVGIDSHPNRGDEQGLHRLLIIDPNSGKTTSTVELPIIQSTFPDLSGRFDLCGVTAVDIDHDAINEVVVSYCHTPYWPSYSVIYDPKRQIAFPVLLASGHHRLLGTIDIDKDGRDELIFWGPSNRLGWYTGVAAVRVDLEGAESSNDATASTPDATYSPSTLRALLWYALVGNGGYAQSTQIQIDQKARTIVVDAGPGNRSTLDLTGFLAGSSASSADVRERTAARVRAYEALRLAIRLSETGFRDESLQHIDTAVMEADRARDVPLGVWARRVRIRIQIRAGRGTTVEPLLRDVMTRFDSPADACWDAANAFHIQGDLPAALHWYWEGLGRLSDSKRGRLIWEYFEGIIFTLAEAERWDEALEAIETFERGFPQAVTGSDYNIYRAWIHWRRTGSFTQPLAGRKNESLVDFCHYVTLESQAASSDAHVDELIPQIETMILHSSGIYEPALLSLKAELLARKGDRRTALDLATRAMAEAKPLVDVEAAARVHMKVIEMRWKALRAKPAARLHTEVIAARRDTIRRRQ